MAKDAPGMHGNRSRNTKGPLREKRGDTYVSKIEEMYNREFNVRGDMHLDTLLERLGYNSLHELIKSEEGKK